MAHPPPDKCPANPASAATCPVAHDAPVAPTPAAATGRGDPPEWVDDGTRTAIPQPPERLLVGNLLDIDRQEAIQSLRRLAHLYGLIFQLRLIKLVCFASSRVIVNQLCDENKFEKMLSSALVQVRSFAGDGLFTAYTGEHNWDLAHRILVPAFGPLAIKKMQPMMMEIISQMLLFWEHHAGQPFEAADQYTRLTFVSPARFDLQLTPRTRSAGVRSATASTRTTPRRCTRLSTSWSTFSSSLATAATALVSSKP